MTLFTGTDPAFSLALPSGWTPTEGPAVFEATGPAGETLVLATGPVAAETTFDQYVERVEADLQADGASVPTSQRRAGSGLTARLETAAATATVPTSLFLYPTCVDGTRTLTITGRPAAAPTTGGPDEWDAIAASVNPCSADAAPVLVIAPEVLALGTAYADLANRFQAELTSPMAPLVEGAVVKVWNRNMKKVATSTRDFAADVEAMAWPDAVRPFAAALTAAARAVADSEQPFVRARTNKDIRRTFPAWGRAQDAMRSAAAALRFEIGLATAPR